jgi:hypothetical protein
VHFQVLFGTHLVEMVGMLGRGVLRLALQPFAVRPGLILVASCFGVSTFFGLHCSSIRMR